MIQLHHGDCLEKMKEIPDGSVDMVLCDLPYGILNKNNRLARWDVLIDFHALWHQYGRITKDNAAIVLFASGMFTATTMLSNPKLWRYNLVWKKGNRPTGFLDANKRPLRIHEDICVFYKKQPTYNPQFTYGEKVHSRGAAGKGKAARNGCYGEFKNTPSVKTNLKYPVSVIDIAKEHPQKFHSTQKPVALCEWLIKTYTNPGETVLDNCMGSGSTGVACVNVDRIFIGIELDEEYYQIAKGRIFAAKSSQKPKE